MKSMPIVIKNKLRQLRNTNDKARKLNMEITELIESYGVNTNYLRGLGDYWDDIQTESLTFIETCEGEVEENIKEIEEIFLHYVNEKNKD